MPTALYRAEHIGPAQMRRGYMLVSMLNPDITPQDWRRFARCAARGPRERGGLIAILDPRGYCHAIFPTAWAKASRQAVRCGWRMS